MKHHLIITADDYGMCPEVNAGIEECLAAGTLGATCVMTNMPEHRGAASLRRRFPQASIGLHWTLTQGQPLLTPAEVPSLVDPAGRFLSFGSLRRRWLLRQVAAAELQAELRAQYRRFRENVGFPDFWNTHQNVHLTPGLFQLFVALGRELDIPAMRCHRRITAPRDMTPAAYNLRHPLFWLKGQIIARWSARAEAAGMQMPAGTINMPGHAQGKAEIAEVCRRLDWSRLRRPVEVIIHPAISVRPELFGRLSESRVQEYQVFKDLNLAHRLQDVGIELVGFEALRNGH